MSGQVFRRTDACVSPARRSGAVPAGLGPSSRGVDDRHLALRGLPPRRVGRDLWRAAGHHGGLPVVPAILPAAAVGAMPHAVRQERHTAGRRLQQAGRRRGAAAGVSQSPDESAVAAES